MRKVIVFTNLTLDGVMQAPRRCRTPMIEATSNTMVLASGMQPMGPVRP
jgi:hypothetical protein